MLTSEKYFLPPTKKIPPQTPNKPKKKPKKKTKTVWQLQTWAVHLYPYPILYPYISLFTFGQMVSSSLILSQSLGRCALRPSSVLSCSCYYYPVVDHFVSAESLSVLSSLMIEFTIAFSSTFTKRFHTHVNQGLRILN